VKRRQRTARANGVRADAVLRSSLKHAADCNIPSEGVQEHQHARRHKGRYPKRVDVQPGSAQDLESDPLVNRGRDRRLDGQHRQRMHADTGDRL
jgi:hypothetical protein